MKFLIACALLALSPANAIDFQLRELRINSGEGGNTDLYFENGNGRIFYRPPPQWKWEGDARRFETTPPRGRAGAMAFESRQPVPDSGQFGSEANLKKLSETAIAELPPNAKEAAVLSTTVEQLGGRELPTVRIVIDYTRDTIRRTRITCYVQFRPAQWIEIRLDSPRTDSPRNQAEAFHSLEAFTEVTVDPAPAPK